MIKAKNIRSPLTNSKNIHLERTIKTSFIITEYKKRFGGYDISKYFHNIKKIFVYKCLDSGYRFYYPYNVDGDGKFYECLEKYPWYYMDWKWEHEEIANIIKPKDKILEIGCGRGGFLQKIQQRGITCTGLELNKSAVSYGLAKKLIILNESIQNHAKKNYQKYNVVCTFQVVEHVAKIKEFLQSSINVLKPGGKLIISVPNNDSLIFKENDNIVLNMPPHHMGMWNLNSLINIQKYFNLRLDKVFLEPLQNYHLGYATLYLEESFSKKLLRKYRFIPPLIRKIVRPFWRFSAKEMSKYILGQSIVAVYTKL